MTDHDYWRECISLAADECGLSLTEKQVECLTVAIQSGRECYDMAFYSPPPGDRLAVIEDGWKRKYTALQAEFDEYRGNAETAVKIALRQYSDANVSIHEYGEVLRHGGSTVRIQ